MFGRTPTVPSGGVNHERIEMAINEYVPCTRRCRLLTLSRIDMVSDVFNRIVAYVQPTDKSAFPLSTI
jgi:hypothetical protein